jgi:hypothetical protein
MDRRRTFAIGITAIVALAVAAFEAGQEPRRWGVFVLALAAGLLVASFLAWQVGRRADSIRVEPRRRGAEWGVVIAVGTVPLWDDVLGSTGTLIFVGFLAAFLITLFVRAGRVEAHQRA